MTMLDGLWGEGDVVCVVILLGGRAVVGNQLRYLPYLGMYLTYPLTHPTPTCTPRTLEVGTLSRWNAGQRNQVTSQLT